MMYCIIVYVGHLLIQGTFKNRKTVDVLKEKKKQKLTFLIKDRTEQN